jgi:hypothetical protein
MKKLLVLLLIIGAMGAAAMGFARLLTRQRSSYGDEDSDTFDLVVNFSGREFESHAQSFAGGSVLVVFGGAEIDFRYAQLDPMGAYLEVECYFGGIEIIVPDTWRVVVNSNVTMGGVENGAARLLSALPEDAPTLEIDARVVLGGVDVQPIGGLNPEHATAGSEAGAQA